MEVVGRKARLTPKARRAMELLAVDERGLTETLLRTYGFTHAECSPTLSAEDLQQRSARQPRLAVRRSKSFASESRMPVERLSPKLSMSSRMKGKKQQFRELPPD